MDQSIEVRFKHAMEILPSLETVVMHYYQSNFTIDQKSDGSFVTNADREVEQLFREKIEQLYPHDNIIGEEFPNEETGSRIEWTIDPIDGTACFARGLPYFGTMIGLSDQSGIQFGIISFPALKEMIYAKKNQGSYWKSSQAKDFNRASVSSISEFNKATYAHSGIEYFKNSNHLPLYLKLNQTFLDEISWAHCFGHALVATGRAEMMIDPLLHHWDIVPIRIITEEAGGIFLNVNGENSLPFTSGISVNSLLAPKLTNFLKTNQPLKLC